MSELLRILTRSMKTPLFRLSFLFTVIVFGFICMPRREIRPPDKVFSLYPVKIEKITFKNGLYKARINNKTVKIGGITGIYTVKSIREGEVVLETGGKTLTF